MYFIISVSSFNNHMLVLLQMYVVFFYFFHMKKYNPFISSQLDSSKTVPMPVRI